MSDKQKNWKGTDKINSGDNGLIKHDDEYIIYETAETVLVDNLPLLPSSEDEVSEWLYKEYDDIIPIVIYQALLGKIKGFSCFPLPLAIYCVGLSLQGFFETSSIRNRKFYKSSGEYKDKLASHSYLTAKNLQANIIGTSNLKPIRYIGETENLCEEAREICKAFKRNDTIHILLQENGVITCDTSYRPPSKDKTLVGITRSYSMEEGLWEEVLLACNSATEIKNSVKQNKKTFIELPYYKLKRTLALRRKSYFHKNIYLLGSKTKEDKVGYIDAIKEVKKIERAEQFITKEFKEATRSIMSPSKVSGIDSEFVADPLTTWEKWKSESEDPTIYQDFRFEMCFGILEGASDPSYHEKYLQTFMPEVQKGGRMTMNQWEILPKEIRNHLVAKKSNMWNVDLSASHLQALSLLSGDHTFLNFLKNNEGSFWKAVTLPPNLSKDQAKEAIYKGLMSSPRSENSLWLMNLLTMVENKHIFGDLAGYIKAFRKAHPSSTAKKNSKGMTNALGMKFEVEMLPVSKYKPVILANKETGEEFELKTAQNHAGKLLSFLLTGIEQKVIRHIFENNKDVFGYQYDGFYSEGNPQDILKEMERLSVEIIGYPLKFELNLA